jgi:hypothetical protein
MRYWRPSACKGPVLVDLDETLYLRNSTEDFIDCARPALLALALLLLRILEVLKPWRLTGGINTRDTWRLCAISTLFPFLGPPGAGERRFRSLLNAGDYSDHWLQVIVAPLWPQWLRRCAPDRGTHVLVRRPP